MIFKVLERDSGDGHTKLWMYLMAMNYILKHQKVVYLCEVYFTPIFLKTKKRKKKMKE